MRSTSSGLFSIIVSACGCAAPAEPPVTVIRAPEVIVSPPAPPRPKSPPPGPTRGFEERPAEGHVALVARLEQPIPYSEKSDARFVPDDALLAEAEAALPVALAKDRRGSGIVPKLPAYHRQYFGYEQSNKRLVFINAFCEKDARMRTHSVMVHDGGRCFFQAVYDVESKTVSWLRVNGEG